MVKRKGDREKRRNKGKKEEEEEQAEERALLAVAPKWPASIAANTLRSSSFIVRSSFTDVRGKLLFPLPISREKQERRNTATSHALSPRPCYLLNHRQLENSMFPCDVVSSLLSSLLE